MSDFLANETEEQRCNRIWGAGNWMKHECPRQDGKMVTHHIDFHNEKKRPYIFPQKPREEKGPRELYSNTHYDSCDGTTCPCYVEGRRDALDNK